MRKYDNDLHRNVLEPAGGKNYNTNRFIRQQFIRKGSERAVRLVDALILGANCHDVEQLKCKDKYARRYLAAQIIGCGLTAERVPLEEWNDALNIFGGSPQDNPERAREALLDILDYKRVRQTEA